MSPAQPGGLGGRLRRLLPALWLGVLLAIALIAAPSLFALLERAAAGRVAGRLFAVEAQLSLALCIALGLIERQRASLRAAAAQGSRISAELLLVLGALFCTVFGQFALQPMMEAARAGQGRWSFGALHAVSIGFYGFKTLLVAALAWRGARS
ncbi:DUF4149 domain-containing protein [Methylibium sp.]|uniref:DUF4149 domain-containing protein n=1 Tax=Methylibium sp. TaxID=2067992 RepID=UPI0025E78C5D|nr:DUF4149 domain-containing protein [Methylibium sp.]